MNECPFEWTDAVGAWWVCDLPEGHEGDHQSLEGGGSRPRAAAEGSTP